MKRLLGIPATLCFLLVLAAQNTEASVLIVYDGKAQCENNPTMIMPNTSLHLMVDSTTVPGVSTVTDSEGRFLMTLEVTSKEKLASLLTAEVMITAPPDACGSPSAATGILAGRPSQLGVFGVISDSSHGEKISGGFHESLVERQDLENNDARSKKAAAVDAALGYDVFPQTSSTLFSGIDGLKKLLNSSQTITAVEFGGFSQHF